jgi:hypothetical protein
MLQQLEAQVSIATRWIFRKLKNESGGRNGCDRRDDSFLCLSTRSTMTESDVNVSFIHFYCRHPKLLCFRLKHRGSFRLIKKSYKHIVGYTCTCMNVVYVCTMKTLGFDGRRDSECDIELTTTIVCRGPIHDVCEKVVVVVAVSHTTSSTTDHHPPTAKVALLRNSMSCGSLLPLLLLRLLLLLLLLLLDSSITVRECTALIEDATYYNNVSVSHSLHSNNVPQSTTYTRRRRRRLSTNDNNVVSSNDKTKKNRILYIITALAEYNSGTRNTVRGSDRLQETLIPVVSEGVTSMIQNGYEVDVYLVAHFIVQPERAALITAALPKNVGFDYWNEATPLGYDTGSKATDRTLENRTLHLARQHRFVIKDKLLQYDIFVVFEDDMLITADHVNHYVNVTNELRRLEELAPIDLPTTKTKEKAPKEFHGTMTKGQLRRMIPGFMRVEVLLDEEQYPAQQNTGPIPIDLQFPVHGKKQTTSTGSVDAKSCCYISDHLTSTSRPSRPNADQLMIWETNILPLGIRQMPTDSWLQWVLLQRGPSQQELNVNEVIGDYWSNRNADYYGKQQKRPAPQEFKYINNMGGWMATREQLYVRSTCIS